MHNCVVPDLGANGITVEKIITYPLLSQKPNLFKELTGVNPHEFEVLFGRFEMTWIDAELERLQQRDSRQRAIGSGRKYALSLQDRLLATMIWLNKQLRPSAVAQLFDVHPSTIIRNRNRVVAALQKIDESIVSMDTFPTPGKGSQISEHPYLEQLIAEQKNYLSGNGNNGMVVALPDTTGATSDKFFGKGRSDDHNPLPLTLYGRS